MYDLELNKAIDEINAADAKIVIIQLPEGLKPKAGEIADFLSKNTQAEILIWGGSCYGSCDIPYETQNLGVDLIIQWGHGL